MRTRKIATIGLAMALSLMVVAATVAFLQNSRVQAATPVRYVAPNAQCGVVGPCFGSIQEAVDASAIGDIVKVAQGVYTGVVTNVVTINKPLTIRGGYSTIEWADASPATQPSIIDGEDSRRGMYISGNGEGSVLLVGLTVRNGHAATEGGAGILIVTGTVEIEDSLIISNTAEGGAGVMGGGLGIKNSQVTLTGNTLANNSSTEGGGVGIEDSAVMLSGNTIRQNEASSGGGLSVSGESTVNMSANIILANEGTLGRGPGILLNGGTIDGENNIVAKNGDSEGDGEGVNIWTGNLYARHWTIAENDAFGVVASNGEALLQNTIVSSHTKAGLFGGFVTAYSTLFFKNTSNCSSGAACNDNITGDPMYINPSAGDYHIGANSAAMDVGIDAGVRTDIDGDPRPAVAGFDVGADERVEYALSIPLITKEEPEAQTDGRATRR